MHKSAKQKKKVLLLAHRALMADYIAEIPELLKDDKRIEYYLLNYYLPDRKNAKSYIKSLLPYPTVNRFIAYLTRWDLIIASSFPQKHLVNNERCPTLFVEHGIAAGGIRNGELFFLGSTIYQNNRGGKIRFSSIFVSSEYNKKRAISIDKQLEFHVKVVGFYHHDKMIELNKERDRIRQEMGFNSNDKVVFTLSSWGPNCLFNQMGDQILEKAIASMDEFKFILNVHPMEHRPKPKGERVWGEYLQTQKQYGFIVREPDDNGMKYMVAADIIVSDFSSMGLNAVILKKPIIFTPFSDDCVAHDGLIWRLRKISPVLKENASDLKEKLKSATRDYSFDKHKIILNEINSELQNAAKLYKKEIYKLLNLN